MNKTTFRSSILAAALIASMSIAFAGNDNGPSNSTATSTATGGAGGAGGHGGLGGAGGVGMGGTGIGLGGSATATGGKATGGNATGGAGGSANRTNLNANSNTNRNDLTNKQGQAQGQQQGQAQGQQQTAKGGNATQGQSTDNANNADQATTVTVGGDVANYAAQQRNPVSTAYAPSIAPTAVCALTMSGGAQGSMFGFSVGGSYIDKNCELLEQVRAAKAIGAGEVANEMMMDVPAFAAAAKRIADRKAPKAAAAPAGSAPVVAATPAAAQYTDPIIRKRLGLQPL